MTKKIVKSKAKVKTHLDCSQKEDNLARECALTTNTLQENYKKSGYATNGKYSRQEAAKVLSRPHVIERVDYYKSKVAAKLDIRVERVQAEVAAIAFMDPIDIFDIHDGVMTVKSLDTVPPWARRAIMSIKQVTRSMGDPDNAIFETTLEVKFHPKVQALKMIAEFKNMFAENNKSLAPKVHLDLTFTGARGS